MNEPKQICDDTEKCTCEHKHGKVYPKAMPVTKSFKIGRNSFCPCGSKKKYKKCCLK